MIQTMEKPCPVSVICDVLGAPRSSFYAMGKRKEPPRKRGPKTEISDETLTMVIRLIISECPFHSEGYKKTWARIRLGEMGLKVGKNRVLRLMRLAGLLVPVRPRHKRGNKAHDGKIVTDKPNDMWGADATMFWTEKDGLCWLFGVADHFNSECVGWVVVKIGNRWAAIDSLRDGVRNVFGEFCKDVAGGVSLRHDHGSQYTSGDFQADISFAGLKSTPGFVGEPECNGVIERFWRTLKEQLNGCCFKDIEEARRVIGEFIELYNNEWILHRLGYRTPVQARKEYDERKKENVA